MITLALATLLHSTALGAPAAHDLSLWSRTGLQQVPSYTGDAQLRAGQELGLVLPIGQQFSLTALGRARMTAAAGTVDALDLQRLALSWDSGPVSLRLGRMTRLDSRGFQHLDGVSVDALVGRPLSVSAWGGRLWDPETWDTGTTTVAGGELRLRPADARTSQLALGYQLSQAEGLLGHRLHGRGGLWGARGETATALVELGLPGEGQDLGMRAGLNGQLPVSNELRLGADLRWEDLPLAGQAASLRSPLDWLAPDGYAIGSAELQWRAHGLSARLSGGPSVRPGEDQAAGGLGHASLAWVQRRELELGAFSSTAAIGGSWIAGGGVHGSWTRERLRVETSTGLYQFQPLDGDAGALWESRLRVEGRVERRPVGGELTRHASLCADLAAGTDHLLAPWFRAGLSLHAQLGQGDWGRR